MDDELLNEALRGREEAMQRMGASTVRHVMISTHQPPTTTVCTQPAEGDAPGLDDTIDAELDAARTQHHVVPKCCPVFEYFCRNEDGTTSLRPLDDGEGDDADRFASVVRVGENSILEGGSVSLKVTSFELTRKAHQGVTIRTSKSVGNRKRVTDTVLKSCVRHVPFRTEEDDEAPRRVAQRERNVGTVAGTDIGKWKLKMQLLDAKEVCPAYNVQ